MGRRRARLCRTRLYAAPPFRTNIPPRVKLNWRHCPGKIFLRSTALNALQKKVKKVLPCETGLLKQPQIDINDRRKQHYEITEMFTLRRGSRRAAPHCGFRPEGECDISGLL